MADLIRKYSGMRVKMVPIAHADSVALSMPVEMTIMIETMIYRGGTKG